jgi:nucleoside-diphosphate-sugar epimerase
MKIAVLGAKGYVGSYLHKYFSQDHSVIPVTRETLNLNNYSEVDRWLNQTNPDIIINAITSGGGTKINDINYTDVQTDLGIFFNFYNNPRCPRYINIGSGAEFDRRKIIHNVKEESILNNTPLESYGFAKNIISRAVLNRENFYTLRLFGCFDSSEPDIRLFKRFLAGKINTIENKFFDYISLDDFAKIVKYYCEEEKPEYHDINCVYLEKHLLSNHLVMLSQYHNLEIPYEIVNKTWGYYTGNGEKLAQLKLELKGLEEGLKNYV